MLEPSALDATAGLSADSAAELELAANAGGGEGAGIEAGLARNRSLAAAGGYEGATLFPALSLFVISRLDPRVDPAHILGLGVGEAFVLRNGGGRVSPEVINNVAFVGQLAEDAIPDGPLFEVAVIHHTHCGAGALADDGFRDRFARRTGADESTLREYAVVDPAATVANDVYRLRSVEAISPRISVSGHVYDVVSGLLETIVPAATAAQRPRRT